MCFPFKRHSAYLPQLCTFSRIRWRTSPVECTCCSPATWEPWRLPSKGMGFSSGECQTPSSPWECPGPTLKSQIAGSLLQRIRSMVKCPPVSSLGLRMDDDTISIAVSLCLGTPLCRPHPCIQCGVPVDESAVHALSCRKSGGQHVRHNAMNDVICRSLTAAGIPCQTEPHSLVRSDGKRPDGVTMLPWKSGHPLVWDATCLDTYTPSYVSLAASRAGAVAEMADNWKSAQYTHLQSTHLFAPVSAGTSGVFGEECPCTSWES